MRRDYMPVLGENKMFKGRKKKGKKCVKGLKDEEWVVNKRRYPHER